MTAKTPETSVRLGCYNCVHAVEFTIQAAGVEVIQNISGNAPCNVSEPGVVSYRLSPDNLCRADRDAVDGCPHLEQIAQDIENLQALNPTPVTG